MLLVITYTIVPYEREKTPFARTHLVEAPEGTDLMELQFDLQRKAAKVKDRSYNSPRIHALSVNEVTNLSAFEFDTYL